MKKIAIWSQVCIVCLGTALSSACKKRTHNESESNEIHTDKLQSEGKVIVEWKCSGIGNTNNQGLNSQEEYCEWTRQPETLGGRKVCFYTTAFDGSRKYRLTKSQPKPPGKFSQQDNPFWATQFNSYAFLRGGSEPDTGEARKGIIGHCIEGNKCFSPNCVPDRASDPEICKGLNFLGSKGCKVEADFQVAPVVTAGSVPEGTHGDKPVKPQLAISEDATRYCTYEVDPELQKNKPGVVNANVERTLVKCDVEKSGMSSCDAIAGQLSVMVTLKLSNPQCVGGTGGGGGGNTPSGPGLTDGVTCSTFPPKDEADKNAISNVRGSAKVTQEGEESNIIDKLPRSFPNIFIRGFVGEFASVSYTRNGEKFGAPARPSFLHISQIDKGSCKK